MNWSASLKSNNQISKKAQNFLNFHHQTSPLILPNAWDVVSAKLFEKNGFKAIGTTSAGIAAVFGYADGEKMSLADNLAMSARIVAETDLPVSVDIESGYSLELDAIVAAAESVLAIGAIGINIEDNLGDEPNQLCSKEFQQEKISAIRAISQEKNVHLVINARTDPLLIESDLNRALKEAIERGNAYIEAGADCVFIPDIGNLNIEAIKTLVAEISGPVNIIAGAHIPPIAQLKDIGIARISLGPRPMRALLGLLKRISNELHQTGTYQLMDDNTVTYAEVNDWFAT